MVAQKDTSGFSIRNKRAWVEFHILEKFEAGLELTGTETKSLRSRNCSFTDAYVTIRGSQAFVENLHIGEYSFAGRFNHDPKRRRRLLLHRSELRSLIGKIQRQGLTLVPLAIYPKGRWLKLEIGLAKGKKHYDKREDLAKRDSDREVRRALKVSRK
ncbi:MAG: SsrA-binding protein SmpB [Candidatus Riflebacteria bacterium]|nr:SsrA-binding protein SmpB [Candidatus Riflebacteria bacterium]